MSEKCCNKCNIRLNDRNCSKSRIKKQHYICRKCANEYDRNRKLALKREIINRYGGQCNCCAEKILAFLAIDHIKGGGSKHRKKIGGGGATLYIWLQNKKFPKGYQVLCFNCNFAKHICGECPHKK